MTQHPDFTTHGYRVETLLGSNPEGGRTAYRAVSLETDEAVVIKRFSFATQDASWAGYQAHEREINMLRHLNHPRIPAYIGDFQTEGGFCMVQKFCDAAPMSTRSLWSPEHIKTLGRSILEILVYLQARVPPVIHRDIKPDNILVDDEGHAHLVDFGLARADRAEATTIAVGTPGFMPPEQLLGHELDEATDLYAVGASLVGALTGTPSSQTGTLVDATFSFDLSRLPHNLSQPFRGWLGKMVAPKRDHRFRSAREALDALNQVVSITAAHGAPRSSSTPASNPAAAVPSDPFTHSSALTHAEASPKRKGAGVPLGVILGCLLVVGAGVALWQGTRFGSDDADTRSVEVPIECMSEMQVANENITLTHNYAPLVVGEGCDITLEDVSITSSVGVQVRGGRLTLKNVKIDAHRFPLDIRGGHVRVHGSSITSDGTIAIQARQGTLVIEDSTVQGKVLGIETNEADVTLTNSSVIAKERVALNMVSGSATITGTALTGVEALWAKEGTLTLSACTLVGGVSLQPSVSVAGLESCRTEAGKSPR